MACNDFFVHESSFAENVSGEETAKIYKNCHVVNSTLKSMSTIGDNCRVGDCTLDEHVAIQRNGMMYSTKVGKFTYTGKNFTSWHCDIGAFCSISWNVSIGGANHDYKRVTTHSFLYNKDFGLLHEEPVYDRFTDECIIGNDVWIGCNACICRGVKIGNGAVIGAGAVVTHDVEPYTVVAGVPAKVIKKRFSEEIIEILQKSNWWDLPSDVIRENVRLFGSEPTVEIAEKIYRISKDYGCAGD